jgi:2-methylcitrate dehydratase
MTKAEQLASFVVEASFDELSGPAREQLKLRILDAIGCAIGACGEPTLELVAAQVDEFDGGGRCSLIGGGTASPDRATFYNGALVRYLDFNDSYLAPGETCHPSDNLAPALAAAQYAGRTGRDLLTALAVAYQVQCRLSDVAPVRARGFDHTTHGSFSVACGVSKALGLDCERTANAIAIAGSSYNALRVTRTGSLSNWKGLAFPNTAFGATHATFLAMRGVTGPREVFEGNKGFMDTISGHFEIDWQNETLERVTRTIVKKYNAEIHAQSAIEGLLEMRSEDSFGAEDVRSITIEIFDVAYHIIGGGEEGDKTAVRTKEEADHSLPYLLAVALLDGRVGTAQFHPDRIARADVQELLRKIVVKSDEGLSARFPEEIGCRLMVILEDGRILTKRKRDYEGFHTRPMSWERALVKFRELTDQHCSDALRGAIVKRIADLERASVAELMSLLGEVELDHFAQ